MESMIGVGDVVERSVGHTPAGCPCRDVGGGLPASIESLCLRQTQAAETGTEQQHNVNVTVYDSMNKPS